MSGVAKYALLTYTTENIGDDIQSLAARRFLPSVDYVIDRDRLGEWRNPNPKETVKLIANGWYMRPPFSWPPTEPTLHILPISMYIESTAVGLGEAAKVPQKVFATPDSQKYLRNCAPVGARDSTTLKFLRKHGIPAYFSGCLTLTLQCDDRIEAGDYVLAVDIPDRLVDFLRTKTSRPIIKLSPYGDFTMPPGGRLTTAEYFLMLYQSAHAVVTTRLHAMLPCLALETPVLLIRQRGYYDAKRYAGLGELTQSATAAEYMHDYDIFNLDNPPANPSQYLSLRRDLIQKCADFTGYDSERSYLSYSPMDMALSPDFITSYADSFSKRLQLLLANQQIDWLKHEQRQNSARLHDLERRLAVAQRELAGLHDDYDSIKYSSVRYLWRTARCRLRRK